MTDPKLSRLDHQLLFEQSRIHLAGLERVRVAVLAAESLGAGRFFLAGVPCCAIGHVMHAMRLDGFRWWKPTLGKTVAEVLKIPAESVDRISETNDKTPEAGRKDAVLRQVDREIDFVCVGGHLHRKRANGICIEPGCDLEAGSSQGDPEHCSRHGSGVLRDP